MTNIFISAGDLSGDIHAANLVRALKEVDPQCRVTALGGDHLQQCADEYLDNLVNLSAFGFWAPVRLYFHLRELFEQKLKTTWDAHRPDKVICVDYYGFNIHVAKEARRRGIPVYYYVSPQVWASRPGRIRKLAQCVTRMLVILPFEEEIYKKAGLDATFVGHPLLDLVPAYDPAVGRQGLLIGLFPGSRPSVLKKHMPIIEKTVELIKKELPEAEFRLFGRSAADFGSTSIPVVTEKDFTVRRQLTLAITTSGTVSLENALLGIPMIVMYRLSRFNYFLAKLLVKVKYITMVNILAGECIVPELIQDDATPEKISAAVLKLVRDRSALERMREKLLTFRKRLGEKGVPQRAAAIILKDRQGS